jgi:hypothetical protein
VRRAATSRHDVAMRASNRRAGAGTLRALPETGLDPAAALAPSTSLPRDSPRPFRHGFDRDSCEREGVCHVASLRRAARRARPGSARDRRRPGVGEGPRFRRRAADHVAAWFREARLPVGRRRRGARESQRSGPAPHGDFGAGRSHGADGLGRAGHGSGRLPDRGHPGNGRQWLRPLQQRGRPAARQHAARGRCEGVTVSADRSCRAADRRGRPAPGRRRRGTTSRA